MVELTVGHSGHYDFYSIQEALDQVPYGTEALIRVKKGLYREKLFSDKEHISILGEGPQDTVITFSDGAYAMLPEGRKRGTFRSYTAFFSGNQLHLAHLGIRNEAGDGRLVGQSMALYLDVRKSSLEDVHLWSHQDTLFLAPLPEKEREVQGFLGPRCFSKRILNEVVVRDSVISGDVDFVFGGSDALFSSCTLVSLDRGEAINGYVAAPCGKKGDRGLVFSQCEFLSEGCRAESVYLMRPWREEGKATFLSCSYGEHIHRLGCSPWPGRESESSFTFAEFNAQASLPMERRAPASQLDEVAARTLVASFSR
ncbi:pectinesterase family protein [Sphaerochaeta sp. PS]|uniref:pectinesterase family protein n=1 Tax=Sphaerochaeta sp. PS TaxID=3076336 RepID=UPI0028A4C85D|nr:pectinesterase family protein [Sphaerochaeta sp. PS]MDT4761792.1 pectinesterase family protein [Sphaerochaeta sp. PS]